MKTTMLAVMCMILVGCGGGGGDDKAADPPAETPTTAPGGSGASLTPDTTAAVSFASLDNQSVKVGCGMCIYEMPGVDSCVLAMHHEGHSMLVIGVEMDLHDHDLCGKEGKALVTGVVENGEFIASNVEVQ